MLATTNSNLLDESEVKWTVNNCERGCFLLVKQTLIKKNSNPLEESQLDCQNLCEGCYLLPTRFAKLEFDWQTIADFSNPFAANLSQFLTVDFRFLERVVKICYAFADQLPGWQI